MFRLQVVLAKLVVLFGVGQVLADTSAGAVPTASGLPPGVESASTDPVRWLPDADGNWRDEENWSSFPDLPGANDDVIIDVGGATVRTVTIDNTSPTVHGLQCEENLNLATGYLRIAAGGGFVNGALSLDGAGLIVQGGGVFTASGATDLTRYGSLRATSGGTLSLPNLQSASTAYHKDLFLSADGEASGSARLDLSELTTVTSTFTEKLYVDALNGGTLDLSSFLPIRSNRLEIKANSGGKIHLGGMTDNQGSELNVVADGVGSEVDLSNLSRLTCGNTNFCPNLTARNGGRILLPDTLTELDGIDVTIGDGELPTGQLTSYTNADLRVEQGASPSFDRLTVLDSCNVTVYQGAVLSMPNVEEVNSESYDHWTASGVSEDGRPSLLDLSSVLEVDTGGHTLSVGAYKGAKVDLRSLQTLRGGRICIYSEGEGSVVDLSGLVSLAPAPDTGSVLRVRDGGTMLLPETLTRLEGIAAVAGRGTIPLEQVTQLVSGELIVSQGTELTLDNLTMAHDASFRAVEGKLSLPRLTTLSMPDRGDRGFCAEGGKEGGPETVLDLSALKTITGRNWRLGLEGASNARLDASALTVSSGRSLSVSARGAGGIVDLSSLTTLRGGGYYGHSHVHAEYGGIVILPETSCEISDTYVVLRDDGIIRGQNLRFMSDTTVLAGGLYIGNVAKGIFEGNVANEQGLFDIGNLLVTGDFVQQQLGKIEMDVRRTNQFSLFEIYGDARLDGTLALHIHSQLDVSEDTELPIITIGGTRYGEFAGRPESSVVFTDSEGDELYLSYLGGDGNDVVLTGVPEPSTLILLSTATLAAIAYGWRRRRRTETLAARP